MAGFVDSPIYQHFFHHIIFRISSVGFCILVCKWRSCNGDFSASCTDLCDPKCLCFGDRQQFGVELTGIYI
jgi:hypothetical protein